MSEQHLRLKPHKSRKTQRHECEDAWWYEDKLGIDVYVQKGINTMVSGVRIPWGLLRAALKRLDTP